jgi:hypothetical protein
MKLLIDSWGFWKELALVTGPRLCPPSSQPTGTSRLQGGTRPCQASLILRLGQRPLCSLAGSCARRRWVLTGIGSSIGESGEGRRRLLHVARYPSCGCGRGLVDGRTSYWNAFLMGKGSPSLKTEGKGKKRGRSMDCGVLSRRMRKNSRLKGGKMGITMPAMSGRLMVAFIRKIRQNLGSGYVSGYSKGARHRWMTKSQPLSQRSSGLLLCLKW